MNYTRSFAASTCAVAALALSGCEATHQDPDDPAATGCDASAGNICTTLGTGHAGFNGDGKQLLESHVYWPMDMAFGHDDRAYITDWNNHRVRRIEPDNTLKTVIGTEMPGDGPADLADLVAPGAVGTTVALNHPTHMTFLNNGNMIVATWHNHKIRQYDPNTGLVLVTSGSKPGFAGDGGPAKDARYNLTQDLAVDSQSNVYIKDQKNMRIRKIDYATGMVSTVAGNGIKGYNGDNIAPTDAQFSFSFGDNPEPSGAIIFDSQDRMYITDNENHRIRRVDFATNMISTIAGNGEAGYSGDGGLATEAKINNPRDVELDAEGNLYIADTDNHRIRKIDLGTGIISTVAGNGEAAYTGDGGPATEASLYRPFGIVFSQEGDLIIADTYNHVYRRIVME